MTCTAEARRLGSRRARTRGDPRARRRAAHRSRASELGLALDSTYTAKTFAALLGDPQRGELLFWNTFDPRRLPTGDTISELPRGLRRYFRPR